MEDLTLSQQFKIGTVLLWIIIFVLFLISMHNTAWERTEEVDTWAVVEREPWMLTEDWLSQLMPELTETTSHERFKELSWKYWLNPSDIWEVENKYGIREWVILAIVIAETSWWKFGYGVEWCYNYGNVWNNDRWDRYCFSSHSEWLAKIWKTLNNQYLKWVQTLGCLSNAGSCSWLDDNWHRYATSNWNRERTIVNVLNAIYSEDLWDIEPSKFNVRRDFITYQ